MDVVLFVHFFFMLFCFVFIPGELDIFLKIWVVWTQLLFLYGQFYSSKLGPKIKDTSLELMKMYIYAQAFSVKTSIHSPTWKLKQNKCTHKCSKNGNTPRKGWFKSNQFKRIHELTSFCLAKEKRQSRMPVILKKTEFAPAGVQAGSSSHTFHPEATGAGGKVQSKKLFRLKHKLLHSQAERKFSNSLFGLCLLDFSWRVSTLSFTIIGYWQHIWLLLVGFLFLYRQNKSVIWRYSFKEDYSTEYKALFIRFLFIDIKSSCGFELFGKV